MGKIIIYSGEKGIGKSSYLKKSFGKHLGVEGILQPRMDGIKYLENLSSGEYRQLELHNEFHSPGNVRIGDYIFSEAVFKWGRDTLLNCFLLNPSFLIIDEIGPLELAGSGLEPALSKLLILLKESETKALLVVRPALIERVIDIYKLEDVRLIHFGEENKLFI